MHTLAAYIDWVNKNMPDVLFQDDPDAIDDIDDALEDQNGPGGWFLAVVVNDDVIVALKLLYLMRKSISAF